MLAPVWQVSLIRRDSVSVTPRLLAGKYDWDISRKIIAGGRLTTDIDPGNLLGASLTLSVHAYGTRHDLGLFAVTSSKPNYSGSLTTWDIEWMDQASRIDRQNLLNAVGLPRMTPVIPAARKALADIGIRASLKDSDRTMRVAMVWDEGTSLLDYVNKLLSIAGLHPLWHSPGGLFAGDHIDPWTAPVVYTFEEGDASLHLPEYPQEQDFLAVPNRLLGTTNGDNESLPMRAVARDVAATQWSYAARGDWVDAPPINSDAVTQEDLVVEVNRRLQEIQLNAITMTIQHMWNPRIVPGCIVNVVAQHADVSGRWQVTSCSTPMGGSGALSSIKLRKVLPNG